MATPARWRLGMNEIPDGVTAEQSKLNLLCLPVTHCDKCGKSMRQSMPVFYLAHGDTGRAFIPACERCFELRARSLVRAYAGDVEAAKLGMLRGSKNTPAFIERPCAECGRPVWKRPRKGNPRVFCSSECSHRFYRHEALRNRKSELNLIISICNACGGAIPDNRRGDTRYCSPACRQKAYRQRTDNATTSGA